MFIFREFYQGKHTSSVENVNHDKVVELILGSLPKINDDPDWSFSVGRLKG